MSMTPETRAALRMWVILLFSFVLVAGMVVLGVLLAMQMHIFAGMDPYPGWGRKQ